MGSGADVRAGRAFVELFLKNSLTKGLAQAQKQLQNFGKNATAVGKTLVGVGVGAAVPMAFLTKTYMDFDDAMRTVKAVSQSTEAEFQTLTATAKKLGASTSFTAIQVAGLMGELGKAGFTAAEVDKMTEAVLNLSRASGTDATLSAGIMATTLKQFEMGAADATRVSDVLTHTANATFNSVEALGEALSYCGTEAKAANMPLEDTFAILGMLGDVGIQGSAAGTVVRRLLVMSGAEAEKMQRIFGVAFKDAQNNARPLVDVLGEVHEATKDMGTAERAAKFNEAFGLLGITGAGVIGKNVGKIKELREELLKSEGVAAATAKEMDAGLGGAFRRMMSAIEGVQIAIGEALAPVLTTVAGKIESVAGIVIKLVNNNKQLAVGLLAAVAGITAAGVGLIALGLAANGAASAIGIVLGVLGGVGTTITFLLSPVGMLTAALVGGVAAWLKWTESGKAAVATFRGIFSNLADTFKQVWGGISAAIGDGNLMLAGQIAFAALKTVALETFESIMKAFKPAIDTIIGLWDIVSTMWTGAIAGLKSAWATVAEFFTGSTDGLGADFKGFAEGLVNAFTAAARAVVEVWQAATAAIAKAFLHSKMLTGVDVEKEQAKRMIMQRDALASNERRQMDVGKLLDRGRAGEKLTAADIQGFVKGETFAAAQGGTATQEQIMADLLATLADTQKSYETLAKENPDLIGMAGNQIDTAITEIAGRAMKSLDGLDKRAADRGATPTEDEEFNNLFRSMTPAERARYEMEQLVKQANKAKADQAAAAEAAKAKGAGEIEAAGAGGIAAMKSPGSSFGSFSAAGLLASSSGGIQQRMLAAQREAVAQAKKAEEQRKKDMAKLKEAVENNQVEVWA